MVTWWRGMTMTAKVSAVCLLGLALSGGCAEFEWNGEPWERSEGRAKAEAAVRLDAALFQECSEPPDNAMIIRISDSSAYIDIYRTGDTMFLDVYPQLLSVMDLAEDPNKHDYSVNQPYEVEWRPELYWTGWQDPLDMQLEYSEEFGYYDPSHPYFPYFSMDHWLTGGEGWPTEIAYLAWWNERAFIPYVLCISHFRPDRLALMLTIDPTRSKSATKASRTPFPVTIISDWSPGSASGYADLTVEGAFSAYPEDPAQPNYLAFRYSSVTESAVWGEMVTGDTGTVE